MLTASGPIADAIAGLTALVANTPFFQTWVGAGSAAEALANIFSIESGFPIAAIAINAGVLTVTTRDTHNLAEGQTITLAGTSIGAQSGVDLAGEYSIVSVPSPSTFTAAADLPDLAETYSDFAFVIPCARPFCVITIPGDGGLNSERIGTGSGMISSGKLEVLLEADTSSQYANDPVSAPIEANNAAGALIEGMKETNDTGLALFTDGDGNHMEFVASDIRLTVSPLFTAKEGQDDNTARFERWNALLEVPWGVSA